MIYFKSKQTTEPSKLASAIAHNIKNSDMRFTKEEFDYVLLPLWTLTYKGGNGKTYFYSINGQTAEICGELPIS